MSEYTSIADYANDPLGLWVKLVDIRHKDLLGRERQIHNEIVNNWADRERALMDREREQQQVAEERLHLAVARIEWEASL